MKESLLLDTIFNKKVNCEIDFYLKCVIALNAHLQVNKNNPIKAMAEMLQKYEN